MGIESSQTRTGIVDLPVDPAQAQPQDETAKANKAREAGFRALVKDTTTSCNFSHEYCDGLKVQNSLLPLAFAFDNGDVTVNW